VWKGGYTGKYPVGPRLGLTIHKVVRFHAKNRMGGVKYKGSGPTKFLANSKLIEIVQAHVVFP